MRKELFEEIDRSYPDMIKMRRYLHQHPELSFEEHETVAFIADFYEKIDVPYQKNVGGNGLVAKINGAKPGKNIALRADFDGLPIQDAKDVSYKSKRDGVMHACGHDGHTTTLLTVAKAFKRFEKQLEGSVTFIHQHAEEVAPGGARPMIEAGVLDGIDYVFGTHLWTNTPYGVIQTAKGNFMAAADKFTLTIEGVGGHGGIPHQTKDPIVIGAQVVANLQQLISRKIDPLSTAVLSIGTFHAGNAYNVIPNTATMTGTVRTFDPKLQDYMMEEMEKIIKGTCDSYGVSYQFDYAKGYPAVENHAEEAELIIDAAKQIDGVEHANLVEPSMTGEDFSYYLKEKPGAFFFTGAQIANNFVPHHHPNFDFDERAMVLAAKVLVNVTLLSQDRNSYS